MGKVFVCADLHFSHKNIIKYEDRPFADADEMNEKLIENWNSVVTKNDLVIVLGDVAFTNKTKTKELVSRLNGQKYLVMGNHDRHRSIEFWRDAGFCYVSPYPIIYGGMFLMSHEPREKTSDDFFYIYGHVHGSEDYEDWTKHSACVSIERLNYKPAELADVLSGKAYEHRKEAA